MKREFSAGGAVFKKLKISREARSCSAGKNQKPKILWILIKPKGGDKFHDKIRWQLPKGWIDEGETSQEAALREVKEEGGVEAKIVDKIDTIKWFFKDIYQGKGELTLKTVTFYLMEWQKDTKEGPGEETAEVVWLPYEEAYEKLTFKSEKEILEKAKKLLATDQTRLFSV